MSELIQTAFVSTAAAVVAYSLWRYLTAERGETVSLKAAGTDDNVEPHDEMLSEADEPGRDIFISYGRGESTPLVQRFAQGLSERGFTVFVDTGTRHGPSIPTVIACTVVEPNPNPTAANITSDAPSTCISEGKSVQRRDFHGYQEVPRCNCGHEPEVLQLRLLPELVTQKA